MTARSANIPAIEKATGLSWEAVTAVLEEAGGKDLAHPVLAETAHELFRGRVDNAGWWAQGAAVAYEQQIGRRVPGQRGDGSFQTSVSKTFAGDPDAALAAVAALLSGREELAGVPYAEAPRTSATEKWRYWRSTMADGSRVGITIGAKAARRSEDPEKSTIGIQVDRLPDEDSAARWRAWFRELVKEL
ncbi:hypothetical protein GCM10022261_22230 [Brevibacterium daeguense]|uniref:Uncharacterized protein n=1 Tax=Brevibacterium daeguense TaxID=909936 RepID=A0ABP8ELN4_9MICO|nr:hypothetical protein [Brevibacterium daeguense]